MGTGPKVEIVLDASPWGLGAFIMKDGLHLEWFSSEISKEEADALGIVIGSSASQQAAEALAILVALRTWLPKWLSTGTSLRVKSDSTSALILTLQMKTRGSATSIIARELALTLAAANFYPAIAEHIPGIANQICDELSRKHVPGRTFKLPAILKNVTEAVLPIRGREFYPTLTDQPEAVLEVMGVGLVDTMPQ